MLSFKFDTEKSIAVILYVSHLIQEYSDKVGFHKIFKILYFADQKHLSSYGRPITGDHYIAMNYGPVPSNSYDILKSIRGDSLFIDSEQFSQYFAVQKHYITPKMKPDLDLLSESEIECLNESFAENKKLGFRSLVDKSHDSAYMKAAKDDKISFREMAKAVGANKEILSYMHRLSENSQILK